MKSALKYILHKLLGFKNYLFVFSLFKINTLKQDKNERDFFHFLNLIPEDTAVLDIGANIGIMTAHLARSIKNVTVYCFEPMPNNLEALRHIIKYYGLSNTQVFDFALGNTSGTVEMVMPVVDSVKMQGLSHVIHKSIADNNEGDRFTVPIKRLDDLEELRAESKRISAIKIDVENFEFFVLDGALQLLEKNRPVVYAELWENENRSNCFKLFGKLNYKTHVVVQNKMVDYVPSAHKTQNFIFIPS